MRCLFCGLEKLTTYFDYGRYVGLPQKLVRCSACRLIQTDPMPDQNFLDNWYQKYDVLGEREPYYQALRVDNPYSTIEGKEIVDRLKLVSEFISQKNEVSLLEVGSGAGLFLNLAADKGWAVTGIEINQKAAEESVKKYNLNIHIGKIENFLSTNLFDAIVLWDVLEHVLDPILLIKKTAGLLKKDGFIFIETPNSSSLLDWFVKFLAKVKIYQPAKTFYGLHHLTLWNKNNLEKVIKENNLKVIKVIDLSTNPARIFRGSGLKDMVMRFGTITIQIVGKIFRMQNKMIVVAQKTDF